MDPYSRGSASRPPLRFKKASMFRSEEMSLVQMYIPREVSRDIVAELGELGAVQFRDLNPDVNAFQRTFAGEIRRWDEVERKLRFLNSFIEKLGIEVMPIDSIEVSTEAMRPSELEEMERVISEHEVQVKRLNDAYEEVLRRYLELDEKRHVLRETSQIFGEDGTSSAPQLPNRRNSRVSGASIVEDPSTPFLNSQRIELDVLPETPAGSVAGVIQRSLVATFERVLWRSLRGNLFFNHIDIDEDIIDPDTDEKVSKSVFVVFTHGGSLRERVEKIAESFGASLYPVNDNSEARNEELIHVMAELDERQRIMDQNVEARRAKLEELARDITHWAVAVKKEKATYHTLNLFNYDDNRNALISEGWCATNEVEIVRFALKRASEASGSNVLAVLQEIRTTKEPPTFIRTNKFTEGFQNIVDAYGVPKAGEANPGLFTVITFPFLFSLMFGDFGHGFIMALAAAFLCIYERPLAKAKAGEIFDMFFGGRYIILLMGLFSIYSGFIYNDIFSRTTHFFKKGWTWPDVSEEGKSVDAHSNGHTYIFGLDPTWHHSENALIFTNSYKMKMSIILGVIHMSFGIFMQIPNARHFKKAVNIWHVFVPQIIFLLSIFGYLCFTIIYKWSINWYAKDENGNNIHNSPPSLLNMLIYMFLSPGSVSPDEQLYTGQAFIQTVLLLMALVCVPWMLLVKPLILRREHQSIPEQGYEQITTTRISTDSVDSDGLTGLTETEEMHQDDFDFGDIMINSVIHTIEFCLNAISNTASYLRLWALSLAHAQLSEVLWSMVMEIALVKTQGSPFAPVAIFLGFAVWFFLTLNILLLMEGLSAFLHALRLHWVEFNGKFYDGTGTKFSPFSFHTILSESSD
ncbi:H(+)-transporting V0 sector ATPase subunit a [Mycoemilia scoparia]|uniref:V-type proton ATPase subunit a n=1 Tax=Mycoemilia scoparia TaxID=417184 RepID=A0A9W8A2Z5_9FUNG|nr:H(+)-transporting V0 sector ATPase subunit a [Mycoemilia scoparia]